MLDAYTSTMCLNLWGRNTYARTLIEVSSIYDLVESLIVAIPFQNGLGHSLKIVDIECEWQPPRCDTCKIFDHTDEHCPKNRRLLPLHRLQMMALWNDNEEVENVFVEDNGKRIDGLVDGRNKVVSHLHRAAASHIDIAIQSEHQQSASAKEASHVISKLHQHEQLPSNNTPITKEILKEAL
ncbi:hypothetical protein Tco_0966622 [Tanacetum coccineum]